MATTSSSNNDIPYRLLLPQALIGLVDALSYMVTSPSLVFYVLQLGGTYSQYGVILSVFSFSSFWFKPVLGLWCDKAGGKFRLPYLTSISVAALGGFVYFLASAFHGRTAIALVFLGRFLGGAGAANQTLGFTYIAQVMPKEKLTQCSAVLSMVRIVGMTAAPALNILLNMVNTQVTIGSHTLTLDPLNTVGILIMFGNMITFLIIYFLLKEPSEDTTEKQQTANNTIDERSWAFWKHVLTPSVMIPMLSIFTLNTTFQLVETCLAPAANDALGWGPVGVSGLFGANAVFIFFAVMLTFRMSSDGIRDQVLLKIGLIFAITGYSMMYLFWENPTGIIRFSIPLILSTFAFPFMGSPTRSLYTRTVDRDPVLRNHQGTMQAILSMIASVAGFTAPGLVSVYVLRTPQEVAASRDGRELTTWALFAPVLELITLAGFLYLDKTQVLEDNDEERQSLVNSDLAESIRTFDPKVEAQRRDTVTLMGIPQFSYSPFQGGSAPSRRHTTMLTTAAATSSLADESRRVSSAF